MFYVAASTSDTVMEVTKLVQKKLAEDEICLQCVECAQIEEGKRLLRFAAVIEQKDEYGVFIYKSSRVPCLQSSDLELESVVAIDSGLHCQAEAPRKQGNSQADLILRLKSREKVLVLEMSHREDTQVFLAEVKRAQDLQSQNAAFGAAPSFAWLDKYLCQDQPAPQGGSSADNPFASDTFDPMKHMNLAATDSVVVASDLTTSGQTTWFEDNFAAMTVGTLSNKNKSQSRDSLDALGNSEFTDSMESLQCQLGISPGLELPVGSKPVSSRDKFVRKFLSDREDEFTEIKNFKVYCGTWNVNGMSPAEALHKWMVVDNDPPDIYAIGFQELDLSKEAFIFSDSSKETEWQNAVKSYLHPKAKYRKVKSIRLVGVMLIVYIQEKHIPYIRFIDSDSVPTGIMGFMGNKGGVSVRFTLHSTSMCFVNSHLAAHQDEFERRNQDYRDIEGKTKFKQFEPPLEISEHDMVFWIGDFNYRIDLPLEEVKSCINKGMYKRLMEHDQLCKQMNANMDVFKGYEEGVLNFDPTYKFDAGTDRYDSSPIFQTCGLPLLTSSVSQPGVTESCGQAPVYSSCAMTPTPSSKSLTTSLSVLSSMLGYV